jgi:hypothetical protein
LPRLYAFQNHFSNPENSKTKTDSGKYKRSRH